MSADRVRRIKREDVDGFALGGRRYSSMHHVTWVHRDGSTGDRPFFMGWIFTDHGLVGIDAAPGAEGWVSLVVVIDGRQYRHYQQPAPESLTELGLVQRAGRFVNRVLHRLGKL